MVGGGAGGVELALAMQHRLQVELEKAGQSADRANFKPITRGKLMPTHASSIRKTFLDIFHDRGIEVIEEDGAESVLKGEVVLSSGRKVPADECIWCTQAAPQSWPGEAGLETDNGVYQGICNSRIDQPFWGFCRGRCRLRGWSSAPKSRSVCSAPGPSTAR